MPNAETAPRRAPREERGSLWAMSASVLTNDRRGARSCAIANACRWAWAGTRRENAVTCGSPRSSDQTIRKRSANVVTLIPPPVDALPAPTNMRKSVTKSVSCSISAVVDRVEAGRPRSDALEEPARSFPAVSERAERLRVRTTRRRARRACRRSRRATTVRTSVSFVCRLQNRGLRIRRRELDPDGEAEAAGDDRQATSRDPAVGHELHQAVAPEGEPRVVERGDRVEDPR